MSCVFFGDREFRDQGFTRPKVLILLPFKNSAKELVDQMIEMVTGGDEVQVFSSPCCSLSRCIFFSSSSDS